MAGLQLRSPKLGCRSLICATPRTRISSIAYIRHGRLRAARLPAARFRVAASAYDADLLGEGRSGLDTDARDIVLFDDQNKDQMLKLLTRLSENDVEYTELKHMCKDNLLGGKDMKHNLRAKLIREVRRRLGLAVWDKTSYKNRHLKRPSDMSRKDLERFFSDREVMMPDDREEAVGLAFAMLVVDGIIPQNDVPLPSTYEKYSLRELAEKCLKRGLPSKGNKSDLHARLQQDDDEQKQQRLAKRAAAAAGRELAAASIYSPPLPPNRALARGLAEAQAAVAAVRRMSLLELRVTLLGRRLPIYGTREVLIERMQEGLRRDVIEAHAGMGRLLKYAAAAVDKLPPPDVVEALAERGFTAHGEAHKQLTEVLVTEWVENAMNVHANADLSIGQDYGDQLGYEDEAGLDGEYGQGSSHEYAAAEAEAGAEAAAGGEDEGDLEKQPGPTLDVVLVCGGLTSAQREASLATARAVLPHLQSDTIWGTLPSTWQPQSQPSTEGADEGSLQPPEEALGITEVGMLMSPNSVSILLDRLLPPPGCVFTVEAVPVDGGAVVRGESADPNGLLLRGVRPATAYVATARLRNDAGYGPPGEPFPINTYMRQGVCVQVLYPLQEGAGEGTGAQRYVPLSWEELYGLSAAELDARVDTRRGAAPAVAEELAALAGPDAVVLPLGHLPEQAAVAGVVGSWGMPETQALVASRPAFAQAARALGFPAAALLELHRDDLADLDAAAATVGSWLEGQGLDTSLTRVAVRAEAAGGVLSAGIGMGTEQIVQGALSVMEGQSVGSVVLEIVQPGAVYFTCSVLGTPAGAVALPPTEISYYDLEEELEASDLQYEQFVAVQEGQDPEAVDALAALWVEESRAHPAMLGALASPTQQLRHHTPPAGIHLKTAGSIRQAAAKLFTELGLRDFAQFSGWVVPQQPAEALQKAMQLLQAEEPDQDGGPRPSVARPFAELQQLDQEERAKLASVRAAQASAADEAGSELAAPRESGVDAEVVVRYGEFVGVELDDRTRLDLAAERAGVVHESIVMEEPPVQVPSALPDLSSQSAQSLCAADGTVIAFNQLAVVPELRGGAGCLAQQAAAAGLSAGALTRQLVSAAAARAGLPTLPPLQEGGLEAETSEAWPPPDLDDLDTVAALQRPRLPTWEEIESMLEEWGRPSPQPDPESYEDILEEAAAEDAAAEAAAAAAGLLDEAVADSEALTELPWPSSMGQDEEEEDAQDLSDQVFFQEEDPAAVLLHQFPGLHPTRQRVWVLCGGEGPLRDRSMQDALSVVATLQGQGDLLVETFMLDPPNAGARDEAARRVLLKRRLDLRRMGATDEELLEEISWFHPSRIKHPAPPPPEQLDWRGVWRLSGSRVVRPSVAEMRHGCGEALAAATTALIHRRPGDDLQQRQQLLATTAGELTAAGVELGGGGGPWGGALSSSEPPAFLFLREWVDMAAQQCAVVLLALPGHPVSSGPLQQALEARGVPFTGSASVTADLCADRPEMMRQLAEWFDYQDSTYQIKMPWHHTISLPELCAKCDSEAAADELFAQLHGAWENKLLVVRPARDAAGLGVMRAACGRDLLVYAQAVRQWWDVIPAELLSLEEEDVAMQVPPPTQFLVETFAAVQPLQLWTDQHGQPLPPPEALPGAAELVAAAGAAPGGGTGLMLSRDGTSPDALHRSLHWPTTNNWLEVKGCLLGALGRIQCLGLTTTAVEMRRLDNGAEVAVGSFDLTPPPPTVLPPAAAAAAMSSLMSVADRLGLSGAALVTTLVNTVSGEMIVQEVDPHPDLTPGGLLFRQAAVLDDSLVKDATDVLRQLLKVGMSRGEENGAGLDAAGSLFPGDEYAAATARESGNDLEPPSPASDYYGDPFMLIEAPDGDDEEEENEEEEDEEEGLMSQRAPAAAAAGGMGDANEEWGEASWHLSEGLMQEGEDDIVY